MQFDITMTPHEALAEIGRRLAHVRLTRNLTQAELALRAGVSKRSLERLEAGADNLRLGVFVAVCGGLGLTPGFDALLPEPQQTPLDILAKHHLPKRARKHATKRKAWGDEP